MSAPIHCLCLSVPPLEEWKSTRCIWIWTSPLLPPSKQFHSSQPACSHSTHNNAEKKILLCINADSPTGCLLWPHQLPPDLGETRVFSPKWKQQQQQLSAPWYTMEETSVKISFKNISGSLPHLHDEQRTLCVDAFMSDNYYQMYFFIL